MKKIFLPVLIFFSIPVFGQQAMFDKKWTRNGLTEMAYYVVNGGQKTEICSFFIDINSNEKQLAVYTTLQFKNSDEVWKDTSLSHPATFQPFYRSSRSKDKEYVLKFGKEVSGYYLDKKTGKRTVIKETITGNFLDSYTYPYLLGLLPLNPGYKTGLPVYDYKPGSPANVKNASVTEVKNNIYNSALTGEHKVWQVTVVEEATGDRYEYYIDQESRRIWKIDVQSNQTHLLLVDKEIDFNPFTTTFNREQTLKMITTGTGVISGQAFARDNENEGLLKGMAVFNVNKKQFAKPGTGVILIPYTDFFKEWIKLNEKSRKAGRAIPLPKEAAECIKVTTVYGDDGQFEFVNLQPGEYLLYTEFGYRHTSHRTEVVGYTDTYINGMFQGSSENTQVNTYNTNAAAAVKKVVSIKKEGDKVSVKLKKTL